MPFSPQDREIFASFKAWISIHSYQNQRIFLKNHLELLDPQYSIALEKQIEEHVQSRNGTLADWEEMHRFLLILLQSQAAGGGSEAIDTEFVNLFSGFALDLPIWLEEVTLQLDTLGTGSQTAQQRFSLLSQLIERAKTESDMPLAVIASLYIDLARALFEMPSYASPTMKYEQALTACNEALKVYSPTYCPIQYAIGLMLLGSIYRYYPDGEQRINIETAIQCHAAAQKIYARRDFPIEWASTCNNLGGYYMDRIEGGKYENIQTAISYYTQSLQVITQENSCETWITLQLNMGIAYERIAMEGYNLYRRDYALQVPLSTVGYAQPHCGYAMQAIPYFEQVLATHPPPKMQALAMLNLGNSLLHLDRLTDAIDWYLKALTLSPKETDAVTWGTIQMNLGGAYARSLDLKPVYVPRFSPYKPYNSPQSILCYKAALDIFTLDSFPTPHRKIQIELGDLALKEGRWLDAHQAYEQALLAQDRLLQQGTGTIGHDLALEDEKNVNTKNGFALFRLGNFAEAALAIEQGRARGFTRIPPLTASKRIQNPDLQQQFIAARSALIEAQQQLDALEMESPRAKSRLKLLQATKFYRDKQQRLSNIISLVRKAKVPNDFLQEPPDIKTILRAAQSCGSNHTLVYLAATYIGGVAIAARCTATDFTETDCFMALDLPDLTYPLVRDLIQRTLDGKVIGGYTHVQEGNALTLVCQQWSGSTLRNCANALHNACLLAACASTLDTATQQLLISPTFIHIIDLQLDSAEWKNAESFVARYLQQLFLEEELKYCFALLLTSVMRPLINWLRQQHVSTVTLIPCGPLAALPLTTIPIEDGKIVGDIFPASIAPSACSLLRRDVAPHTERAGVYTLGDPWPSHQELPWGEAEAHTLKKIAQLLGLHSEARVQTQATRKWLIEQAFRKGRVLSLACHGMFDKYNFLRSALLLAHERKLLLNDLLNEEVDLHGLRLLILSACQTQVLNLNGAYNEVRSLAVGALQAGAEAVLGSLWFINDKATYLLMVRFALEWFPNIESEPPATALARAQRWLREVTNSELAQWKATILSRLKTSELEQNGTQQKIERWLQYDEYSQVSVAGELLTRHPMSTAEEYIQRQAEGEEKPDACPYASPGAWASFQVIGW